MSNKQLFLKTLQGKTQTINFITIKTLSELKDLIKSNVNDDFDNYRYIISNKPIEFDRNDTDYQNDIMSLIYNLCTIWQLGRLKGGSKQIILSELKLILHKPKAQFSQNLSCAICANELPCLRFHCETLCVSCFSDCLIRRWNDSDRTCILCKTKVKLTNINGQFDLVCDSVESQLDDVEMFSNKINVHLCDCGAININETLYSKQRCMNCKKEKCSFCDTAWSDKMKNQKYYCSNNCRFKTAITYELLTFEMNHEFKIPSHRICPKCKLSGAYDAKCKFHVCTRCKHQFCFLCLKEKSMCPKSYNSKCSDPVIQNFDIFDKL